MKNLLSAEFYYLFKNIRFWVFVGITVVAGLVFNIVPDLLRFKDVMTFVVYVFVIIITLEFAHKDFKLGTMKNYVGSGISLFKVYFGKWIVCLTALFIMWLASDLTVVVGEITTGNFIAAAFGYRMLELLINLLTFSVVFFICSLIRSGSIAIIVSLVYMIVIPVAFPMISQMINNSMFNTIYEYMLASTQTKFHEAVAMIMSNQHPVIEAYLYGHLAIGFAVVAGITVLGAYLFSKKTVR